MELHPNMEDVWYLFECIQNSECRSCWLMLMVRANTQRWTVVILMVCIKHCIHNKLHASLKKNTRISAYEISAHNVCPMLMHVKCALNMSNICPNNLQDIAVYKLQWNENNQIHVHIRVHLASSNDTHVILCVEINLANICENKFSGGRGGKRARDELCCSAICGGRFV